MATKPAAKTQDGRPQTKIQEGPRSGNKKSLAQKWVESPPAKREKKTFSK